MKDSRYPLPIDPARSNLMRRVRRHGTKAEEEVAVVMRKLGLRFRRNVKALPGSPDFANKRRGWVVFVHGCFWHRHEGCIRTTTPTHNRKFWLEKFKANKRRDKSKARILRRMGFDVVTVWECEAQNPTRLERRLAKLVVSK